MQENGERSPLDIIPILDIFELSLYRTYGKLCIMKSSDGYINAQDYIAMFALLDITINKNMMFRILSDIDYSVVNFRHELEKSREQVDLK